MRYAFILGNNPTLSVAEIKAVVDHATVIAETRQFLVLETDRKLLAKPLMEKLGGTIKIGEVLDIKYKAEEIAKILQEQHTSGKCNFGFSYYERGKDKIGMEVKRILKDASMSARLVVGRDNALSSVIVKKNKCTDFLVLENKFIAQTLAVQDFEEYGKLDFGRPARDTVSGTLPPKLAKMMINIARPKPGDTLLDPFCGSGTILQQALLLEVDKVIGSDKSPKAIDDTQKNLTWLYENATVSGEYELFELPVEEIAGEIKDVNVIVTEPYLGPPQRGRENAKQLHQVVDELTQLYEHAFSAFATVIAYGGTVVFANPFFTSIKRSPDIIEYAKKVGFTLEQSPLQYSRPDQYVARDILVFRRT